MRKHVNNPQTQENLDPRTIADLSLRVEKSIVRHANLHQYPIMTLRAAKGHKEILLRFFFPP